MYFAMSYQIKIGSFSLKALESVHIVKSIENLSDTATIVLPGRVANRSVEVESKIKAGDRVEIKLGYDNNLEMEFKGYINNISTDDGSIRIECTDDIYLFKKTLKNREHKNITLKALLEDIIGEINGINRQDGAPTDYKLDCDYEFSYEKYVIYRATGVNVLQKVQEDTKANIYFAGDTLHVHAPYSYVINERAVIYDFSRNIESSDLKYVRAADKKVEVEISMTTPQGNTKTEKAGNSGGVKIKRTIKASSGADLKRAAENEYNIWVYDGFEGSFTGWLIPYVEPAYKVELRDAEYPYKNGVYYVVATETSFSASGGKRTVNLGRRLQ
jgi:hypothetical protein